VYGVLEFSNEEDTLLAAKRIIVVGGKIIVGWKDDPLKVKATIRLTGDPLADEEMMLPDNSMIGFKVM
jgi:hypothetical protein